MSPVGVDEVAPQHVARGRSRFVRRALGRAAGSVQLGCSHMTVPPGHRSWPRHWHAANEEAIYVLEGGGVLEFGEERLRLRPGHYVALPAGPSAAHTLFNDGEDSLVYLCVSTMHPVDVTGYPDSGKVGLFGGAAPGGDKADRFLEAFVADGPSRDYWDGEE